MILRATDGLSDLSPYKSRTRWNAEAGTDGAGGRKSGRRGADLKLDVPVGTFAVDDDGAVIADLDHAGATAVVAHGGAGGRGNVHFKSSARRAPDYAEPGLKGEELPLVLDLKLIADVGLVGPPNAGKSSLLRALTAARPKVAAYPFTTLDPQLGVADSEGGRVVIADIPGLIDGAAGGKGLGLRFLRHVERTKVVLYVIDGSSDDPWHDLAIVRGEVEQFSYDLARRPSLIAVNKLDLAATRVLRKRNRRKGVSFISALTGEGLAQLTASIVKSLAEAPVAPAAEMPKTTRLPVKPSQALAVARVGAGFVLTGTRLERLVERTDLDSEAALQRFQVELDRLGVNQALEAAGAQPGDSVTVSGVEFEYQP